jgi:hypothetical protein
MERKLGIFAAHGPRYADAKLSVIPTCPDNAKMPAVRWKAMQRRRPSPETVDGWANRMPDANIGIVTGAVSNLTIVDVDDANHLSDAIQKFGDTPIKVKSPRIEGGFHLWYRYGGERNATGVCGLKIDIRGEGGFVAAPPSHRVDQDRAYVFLDGGLECLGELPPLQLTNDPLQRELANRIGDGQRNDWVFRQLLKLARHCEDEGELANEAFEINQNCDPHLPENEVLALACKVWGYRNSGKLMAPGHQYAVTDINDIKSLTDAPNALVLLTLLQASHEGLRKEFILANAIAGSLAWDKRKFKCARDILVERRFIEITHAGGVGPHDPPRAKFIHQERGAYLHPNTTDPRPLE